LVTINTYIVYNMSGACATQAEYVTILCELNIIREHQSSIINSQFNSNLAAHGEPDSN